MSIEDRLITRFGEHRRIWRWRTAIRNLRFRFSRRAFGFSYSVEQKSATATALPYLLRNAVLPVLLALALVVGMDLLNGAMAEQAKDWGWPTISGGTYDILFEAAAATTGIFLALYFTAVSTVAANVYVNVPHDIRALLVKDRLGTLYVSGVAFTAALSVLLLIAHVLTGRAYWLAAPIIGLLAAFSIFAFIQLGQRAFYLADPTLLANSLAYDFNSWFKRAKVGGHRWHDPNFQQHYRRQARASASSLASLLDIANDQKHLRGGSLRQLTNVIVALLTEYINSRDKVPTTSRWFGERYEHKQWYLTDSTELDTATETSTTLRPRSVPDVAWVEDLLLAPLVDLFDSDLEHEDYEGAFGLSQSLTYAWTSLGQRWSAPYAAKATIRLTESAFARLTNAGEPSSVPVPILVPAIWDGLAFLPLTVELAFHRGLTDRSVDQLRQKLRSTDWSKAKAPYSVDVPRDVIATLEKVQAGRAFENAVDAPTDTQTPGWYVGEIAFNSYEHAMREQVTSLIKLLTTWYPATAKRLAESKMPEAAGAVLSRGVEVVWKIDRHLAQWQEVATELRAQPLQVDLKRPDWDWDALRAKIVDLRAELLRQLAALIPQHIHRERSDDMPDYLGEAVHRVGEAAFTALAENNDALFSQLFPTYFLGVLAIVDRIQEQVTEWHPEQAATAIAEPVIDLMDLSGYALVFAQLHGNQHLWQICEAPWLKYVEGNGGAERLRIIALLHRHQRHLFALTHRATARTRWQMRISEILGELPREGSTSPFHDGPVEHPSPLIRRIAPDIGSLGGLMFQASDIFVIEFLRNVDGGGALDFGVADWVAEALDDEAPEEE